MITTFFRVYPQLVKRFSSNGENELTFLMYTNYNGVVPAGGNVVRYSATLLKRHPAYIDVMVYKIMHVVWAHLPMNLGG